MSCALFDLGCHAQSALWGLVNLVPWWAWIALAIAGLGAAYRFGGWPSVAALAFGYGVLWGARRTPEDAPQKPAAPPRKTAGKRRYNPDTNTWE